MSMIYYAIIGNLSYSLSVFFMSSDLQSAVPFLLGSIGTMTLDAVIAVQHKVYT